MATRQRRASFEPRWIIVLVFFIAGAFGGILVTYLYINAAPVSTVKLHFPKGTFQFTNPTLATEPADVTNSNTSSTNLEMKLQNVISQSKTKGVSKVGIYYRDLEPGRWLDINSDMQFTPGKLLKIPIMITYYKLAEQDPSILQQQLQFNGPYPSVEDPFSATSTLVVGQSYTVDDLITRMIVNSDDASSNLLFKYVDKSVLNETFADLGIDFLEDEQTQDYISIRRYSLFLRVLYNATYLSPEYSEKALALMSHNKTQSLLQSELPNDIPFVSRLGGFTASSSISVYECDIVYYPNHDYLLCATAEGSTKAALKNLFSQIGNTVYQDTTYRYGS